MTQQDYPPDFRALCAELVDKIDYTWGDIPEDVLYLMQRARAALSQPEPQGPTDEELQQFLRNQDRLRFEQESPFGGPDYDGSRARAARVADIRVALARWGK